MVLILLPWLLMVGVDDSDRLQPGTRVEIDGLWRGDHLEAEKVVVEEPDPLPEIKGYPDRIDLDQGKIFIEPFTIVVTSETDIEDDEDSDDSYRLDELRLEWRLKIEGELTSPREFQARVIDVDRSEPLPPGQPRPLELEGYVNERWTESDGALVLLVLGIECRIGRATDLPPGVFRKSQRLVDDDEDRPVSQLVLWDRLTIGGEVQVDFELEDDFDLDAHENADLFSADTSAVLEGLFDLDGHSYLFAKGRTAKAYVIFDENRDRMFREQSALEELYVNWDRMLGSSVSLQLGRQDFDEEREWLYDENLDAARLIWQRGRFELEYSWSTYVADAPRGKSNLFNQIAVARWRYDRNSYASAYVVDIQDHSRADVSPFFLGCRLYGRTPRLRYWLDYAYVDGVEGTSKIEGHGLDVGGGYQLRAVPLRPYLYGGYAFGTGDDKMGGRTDRNFRQTGYQDNNDKLFGVASFRYYGEMLRPELSNLHVSTLGLGFQPSRSSSVDIVYHTYEQHEASTTLRDTELRASPSGRSRRIGSEIDLIVGLDDVWDHFDAELDLGYFMPGHAFAGDDHPALWVALQLEWNF